MSAAARDLPQEWRNPCELALLGMGTALPGAPLSTEVLLDQVSRRFALDLTRPARAIATRLGIRTRHICRDLNERRERPRSEDTNAQLTARAVREAMCDAGVAPADVGYLICHTATPGELLPPNAARVSDLVGYDGPYLELRQACTGFANALAIAQGLLATSDRPIVIAGSETGSVYFDPFRAALNSGQLVNMLQMGDGAAACVIGGASSTASGKLSHLFFGQIGRGRTPAFALTAGGSDTPIVFGETQEFTHDFLSARSQGAALFEYGIAAARRLEIDAAHTDYVVPHQANGRMAALLAKPLALEERRIFVNADRVGNTGSAAIWLALAELRRQMQPGQSALILGAEATKYMYGGFLYVRR